MTLPNPSPRIRALLEKARSAPLGRLIIAMDATGSREPMWDLATSLTVPMVAEAAKLGGLAMQIISYGGSEFRTSPWTSDAAVLIDWMTAVRCKSGATQIGKVLEHVRTENRRERVAAMCFIGDAVEEQPEPLYAAAANLGVPGLWFQEGNGVVMPAGPGGFAFNPSAPTVETVFRELARLTGGAYGKFDAGAARMLGELLHAAVAFAVGGAKALANQRSDAARLLLTQMKHGG